jgi:hypothetical protein
MAVGAIDWLKLIAMAAWKYLHTTRNHIHSINVVHSRRLGRRCRVFPDKIISRLVGVTSDTRMGTTVVGMGQLRYNVYVREMKLPFPVSPSGELTDLRDKWSTVWLLIVDDENAGTVRCTLGCDGQLEIEQQLPEWCSWVDTQIAGNRVRQGRRSRQPGWRRPSH